MAPSDDTDEQHSKIQESSISQITCLKLDQMCTSKPDRLTSHIHLPPLLYHRMPTRSCPLDESWLLTFVDIRLNVPLYFWRYTKASKRLPCKITSIDPTNEHGAYFGFQAIELQGPLETYWMNYDSVREYVDRSQERYTSLHLPKTPPPNQHHLDALEKASRELTGKQPKQSGDTESEDSDEEIDTTNCPHDVVWLKSLVGARLQVRAYYWEAYRGNKKYPGEVTKVHPSKADGAYFQFQLDDDVEKHQQKPNYTMPNNYFLNYSTLLDFIDKDHPTYRTLHLPKRPPGNPHHGDYSSSSSGEDGEDEDDAGCDGEDDNSLSGEKDEPKYKCFLCGLRIATQKGYAIHLAACKNRGAAFAMAYPHRNKHFNKKARKLKPIQIAHDAEAFTAEARQAHALPQDRAVTREVDRLFAQPSMEQLGKVAVCNRVLAEVEAEIRRERAKREEREKTEEGSPRRKSAPSEDTGRTLMSPREECDPDFGGGGGGFEQEVEEITATMTQFDFEDMEGDDDEDSTLVANECDAESDPDRVYAEDKWLPFLVRSGSGEFMEEFNNKERNLPAYYVMQICLLKLLEEHSNTDLGMHERILNIMHHFSTKYPRMWAERHKFKHHTRKSVVQFLAKHFGASHHIPQADTLYIDEGQKKITVPTFDFKRQMASILTDSSLMIDENFVNDPNFDKETLRPTKSFRDYTDDDVIDEPTTGRLYHQGVEMYCPNGDERPPDVDMIVPLPCILYADEVSTCAHGDLSIENVVVLPAFFNHQTRSKLGACRTLGAVPNLGAGHGKFANNYDDEYVMGLSKKKSVNSSLASLQKAKDYQEIYRHILKSFRECCEEGGLRVMFKGKRCLFKPFVIGALGDAKGLNIWVNHYNCNGSVGVNCLVKDCHCKELDIVPPRCVPITREERRRAVTDLKYAHEISYHP